MLPSFLAGFRKHPIQVKQVLPVPRENSVPSLGNPSWGQVALTNPDSQNGNLVGICNM
jgi:hypothetical protein